MEMTKHDYSSKIPTYAKRGMTLVVGIVSVDIIVLNFIHDIFLANLTMLGSLVVGLLAVLFLPLESNDKANLGEILLNIANKNLTKREEFESISQPTIKNAVESIVGDLLELIYATESSIDQLAESIEVSLGQFFEIIDTTDSVNDECQNMKQNAEELNQRLELVHEQFDHTNMVVNDFVKNISQNIKIIEELAMKTKVLSMNASLEAAKAGDYGRGFAVVADNVGRLSKLSNGAVEEIELNSSSIIDTLKSSIEEIKIIISEATLLSENNLNRTEEVTNSVLEIGNSIEEMTNTYTMIAQYTEKPLLLVHQYELNRDSRK